MFEGIVDQFLRDAVEHHIHTGAKRTVEVLDCMINHHGRTARGAVQHRPQAAGQTGAIEIGWPQVVGNSARTLDRGHADLGDFLRPRK